MTTKEQFEILGQPFPFVDIELKPQSVSERNEKALCVPYIRAAAARRRLNEVFSPWNWSVEYREVLGKGGGMICALRVKTADGTEVLREGMAGYTDIEAIKGGESDAFKRAFAALGNDTMQDAELGWHPCEMYESNGKKKFQSWKDLAAIKGRYDRAVGNVEPAPQPSKANVPAGQTEPQKELTPLLKMKAMGITTDQASALARKLGGREAALAWCASLYDEGARSYDDLLQNLPGGDN